MEAKDENILQFSKNVNFSNRKFSHFSTKPDLDLDLNSSNNLDPNPDSMDMDQKQRIKVNTVASRLAKRLAFHPD
jgi:hypothetical protein